MILSKNERIYYTGDMANIEGTGTITAINNNKWGSNYIIKMDDGRTLNVSSMGFSEKYSGNGSTRFVTLKAFNDYRKKKLRECGYKGVITDITEV